jgi:hypothetical protein
MATTNPSLFGMLGDEAAMQRQLDEQRAAKFAEQTQEQRLASMGYSAGAGLGRGIAGAFGVDVTDPVVRQATQLRQLASEFDTTTPEGMMKFAQAARSISPDVAQKAALQAQSMMETQSKIAKNLRETKAADPFQKLVETAKYTPESLAKYKESGDVKDLTPVDKAGTSEFERLVDGLNISPEAKAAMKEKRVNALLSGDTNGLKALQAEIAQARLDDMRSKTQERVDKAAGEKTQAISRLASTESDIESALGTAEAALKLAPNTFLEAGQQAITSSIPWSDAKSLKNLVGSLNSAKAIQTLEQLKSQSRTGATGFGALSEKELDLILNKTRTLDPTDRMFKENVQEVLSGWQKIRQQLRESRFGLQGNQPAVQAEQSITATMNYNKGMTRSQAINFLKQQGKLPSNF